jgi:predicted RNase H-like HicB family nuclease
MVILIPHGDGGYTAEVPTLPGCVTEGRSLEQAVARAKEAAEGWIETAATHGYEIPIEPEGTQVLSIEVEIPSLAAAGS